MGGCGERRENRLQIRYASVHSIHVYYSVKLKSKIDNSINASWYNRPCAPFNCVCLSFLQFLPSLSFLSLSHPPSQPWRKCGLHTDGERELPSFSWNEGLLSHFSSAYSSHTVQSSSSSSVITFPHSTMGQRPPLLPANGESTKEKEKEREREV